MSDLALLLFDAVAVLITAFALYFPRYRRRDIVLAILMIHIVVVALALVLTRSNAATGLGLGLFGVLSIVRLRSEELDQSELAYYFASIALGLLAGVQIAPAWLNPTLIVVVVAALAIFDHPRLFAGSRSQVITLDAAVLDEGDLAVRLEQLLGAPVLRLKVKRVDLVNDTTVVDVRYRLTETSRR